MKQDFRPSAAFEAALAAVRRFGEGNMAVVASDPNDEMLRAGMEAGGGLDAATVRAVWRAMVERSPTPFDPPLVEDAPTDPPESGGPGSGDAESGDAESGGASGR